VVLERGKYEPFGERRSPWAVGHPLAASSSATTTRGFAGHEQADALGLIDMQGRTYDPRLGRFMSPDPFVDPFASQGLNRYSYVRNSPVARVDPTGLFPEDSAKEHDPIIEVIGEPPPPPPVEPALDSAMLAGGASVDSLSDSVQVARGPRVSHRAPGELRIRSIILVGDPGLGRHNVGRNFMRAAETRKARLEARGHIVELIRVSGREDIVRAMKDGRPVTGEATGFMHGGSEILEPGERSDPGTNLETDELWEAFGEPNGHPTSRLEPAAVVTLLGCHVGAGQFGQVFADVLQREVHAFKEDLVFGSTPTQYRNVPGDLPPNTGPLFMVPPPGAHEVVFHPR
jgi:RHS repeat-associated protein